MGYVGFMLSPSDIDQIFVLLNGVGQFCRLLLDRNGVLSELCTLLRITENQP